jgi:hypothetical protein
MGLAPTRFGITHGSMKVDGTDNFRSEPVSTSVFKDIVCNYSNLMNIDVITSIACADIRGGYGSRYSIAIIRRI